ncbi:MAG: hypothetical protein JNK47_00140 [Mesorhizobium sp.]|nr:hypothetical protein [Mesorhizobium sp.]MBL8575606.1 hypothetical protein [Mesorhizobium sp.]
MPRYYFDTTENQNESRDEEGIDLVDERAARDEAIRALPGFASEHLPDGPQHSFWVRVRDQRGSYIFEASLDLKTHWLAGGELR